MAAVAAVAAVPRMTGPDGLRSSSSSRDDSQWGGDPPNTIHKQSSSPEMRDRKRKRSSSIDMSDILEQHPYEHDSSNLSRPQHLANRALLILRSANEPSRGHPRNVNGSGQDAHTWQEPRPPQPTGHVNDGQAGRPGAQLAELLQQDTIEVLQPRGGQLPGLNDELRPNGDATPPQYPQERLSGVRSTGPKRKRNFSNRTKTGCMTCRERKKKCDERHPHCYNCIKGGFECKGYITPKRTTWELKMKNPPSQPMPIQSRNGLDEVSGQQEDLLLNGDAPSNSPHQQQQQQRPQREQHIPPFSSPREAWGRASDAGHSNNSHAQRELSDGSGNEDGRRPALVPQYQTPNQQQHRTDALENGPGGRPASAGHHPRPSQQGTTLYASEQLPSLAEITRSAHHSPIPGLPEMSRQAPPSMPYAHSPVILHHIPPQPHAASQMSPPYPFSAPATASISHTAGPANGLGQSGTSSLAYTTTPSDIASPSGPAQTPLTEPWPASQHHNERYLAFQAPPGPPSSSTDQRGSSGTVEPPRTANKHFYQEDVERSRMMRQAYYNHHDATLRHERDRCKRAITRYNDLCKLDCGLNKEHVRDVLWMVFDPSKDTVHKPLSLSSPPPKGLLSMDVMIEPPFRCTYGYNIFIMDSVYIGEYCTIDDAGGVEIGARTHIGPGVTIFTSEASHAMLDRKGVEAPMMAKRVTIGANVIIGRGAVIYPGVTIELDCTIEPFAVVRRDMKRGQTMEPAAGILTSW